MLDINANVIDIFIIGMTSSFHFAEMACLKAAR